MNMQYAAQRYAATRPWAKKTSQIFTQTPSLFKASQEVAQVLSKEMSRASQVYQVAPQARRSEGILTLAYGCFVREGRVIADLDKALLNALSATKLPANLPDTLNLPAKSFYLHLPEMGGAFLFHDERDQALDIVLIKSDFASSQTEWLSQAELLFAIRISYPGELQEQIKNVPEEWQTEFAAVMNSLAMMTQPKCEMSLQWQAGTPADLAEKALNTNNYKARQKARSQLLQSGFVEVSLFAYPSLEAVDDYQTQGYWRRQMFGENKEHSRLVWVAPR